MISELTSQTSADGETFAQFSAVTAPSAQLRAPASTPIEYKVGASGIVKRLDPASRVVVDLTASTSEVYVRRYDKSATQAIVALEYGEEISSKDPSPVSATAAAAAAVAGLGYINAKLDHGAKGDGVILPGAGTITQGSTSLAVVGASFTAADVGKLIYVYGAGAVSSGSWAEGTAYAVGQIIDITVGAYTFPIRCTVAHTSVVTAAWATATAYVYGDFVLSGGTRYKCLIPHTSATFATELTAGNWVVMLFNPYDFIHEGGRWEIDRRPLKTAIASVTDATHVVLADTAVAYAVTKDVLYGTDDTTACQSAIDAAGTMRGTVFFPDGCYLLSASLAQRDASKILGQSMDFPNVSPDNENWADNSIMGHGTVFSYPQGTVFQQDFSNQQDGVNRALHNSDIERVTIAYSTKGISHGGRNLNGSGGCEFANLAFMWVDNICMQLANIQSNTLRRIFANQSGTVFDFRSDSPVGDGMISQSGPNSNVYDTISMQSASSAILPGMRIWCTDGTYVGNNVNGPRFFGFQINRAVSTTHTMPGIWLKGGVASVAGVAIFAMDLEGDHDEAIFADGALLTYIHSATGFGERHNTTIRLQNSSATTLVWTDITTSLNIDGWSAPTTFFTGTCLKVVGTQSPLGVYSVNATPRVQYGQYTSNRLTASGANTLFTESALDLRTRGQFKTGTWTYPNSDTIWVQYTSGTILASATVAQTLTLPDAAAAEGETITIIKIGASGVLTIANVVGGNATVNTTNASVQLRATAAGWRVIGRYLT